jgi:Uma2 family endonuclease
MSVAAAAPADDETVADLLERLGNIPPNRVRMRPWPGTATEADWLALAARHDGKLYELVDGVLVEKAMGLNESGLALALGSLLRAFVVPRNLGMVTGPDGGMRLAGPVRLPDVSFISWDRLPGRRRPTAPVPDVAPDLAVEVLSASNTPAEMERKRGEYFRAGVRLVWIADPGSRTVDVYTSPDQVTRLTEADTLDGGAVLPGFALSLRDWFAELDRHG